MEPNSVQWYPLTQEEAIETQNVLSKHQETLL